MKRDDAVKLLEKITLSGDWGAASTVLFDALGLSFDAFLQYSQADEARKKKFIQAVYKTVAARGWFRENVPG